MSTIVLHDAQNLGEWRVDEALPPGLQVIGMPHAGEQRSWEYVGDGLDAHVERVVATVAGAAAPLGVGGSSFGAYASLYTWALHPTLFTRVLAMSPALWVRRERVFDAVRAATPAAGTRVWIDVGGRESDRWQDRYDAGYRAMRELLEAKGCSVGGYRVEEAIHHETAWAARLPSALAFLYRELPVTKRYVDDEGYEHWEHWFDFDGRRYRARIYVESTEDASVMRMSSGPKPTEYEDDLAQIGSYLRKYEHIATVSTLSPAGGFEPVLRY